MAEWMEVMNQFNRMCWHYQREHKCPMECPMDGMNISQCRKIAFEWPDSVEDTVMSWAEEHPEPVYPTWFEWLMEIGVVSPERKYYHDWLLKPIPADIAEKLGVKPKEG